MQKWEADIVHILKTGDVAAFTRMFQVEADWPAREFMMSGLRYLVESCQADSLKIAALRLGLEDIAALCQAERTGGSYRDNCIEAAESWLRRLRQPAGANIMTERMIEIEADSLEEAREQVKSQIPEGFHLLSETVVSDGKLKTAKGAAETTEAAFLKAQDEIPKEANIIGKKELSTPEHKTVVVEAFDEQSAREEVQIKIPKNAIIKSLKLVSSGKKGFLGIAKKPSRYEAEVLHQAAVEIVYKQEAKISVRIVEKVQAALSRYHQIQVSSDLDALIRDYDDGTLVAMIEMLDIARLPVSIDTPGMHGMQCMKILELSRWLSQAERKEVMRACHKKLSELGHMEWRNDNVGVYGDVMFQLGMDVIKDGDDKTAYEILESISAHGGRSSDAIVWAGACALNMGDKQKAREHFEQVLKTDPSNRMASDLLKRC